MIDELTYCGMHIGEHYFCYRMFGNGVVTGDSGDAVLRGGLDYDPLAPPGGL